MRNENGRLILEERDCTCNMTNGVCPPGRVAGRKRCGECNGTGNGKRGGRDGCKKCHGFRTEPDFTNHVMCGQCEGTGQRPETDCDSMPPAMWAALDFRVYRAERRQTWNEEYLGAGYAWSSTDYGRAWKMSDEEIIAMVKGEGRFVQACKVVREGTFCDHVAICVMPGGYTVQGVFTPDADPTIDRMTAAALAA